MKVLPRAIMKDASICVIESSRVGRTTMWLVFRTRRGKPPQRLIARPPNRGDTLKSGPVLVAVVTKLFVKTLRVDYVMSLRLKRFD